jgi:flagellin
MALAIATNTGALMAAASATSVNKDMETSMERLSTGKRINSAKDDAAGVAIASRMTSEINGLNQAVRNAGDGQALASTAEGAMVEIENMLQRMRELAVQAANDTNSSDNRAALDSEISQLQGEIDRIVDTTNFNGRNLLDGSAAISLQVGASSGQTMSFSIGAMGTTSLGSNGAVGAGSVLTASYNGTEAETTRVQMAFNGNDSFTFDIDFDVDGSGTPATLNIQTEAVLNGSAAGIAQAINDAASAANIENYISATVSGNVVSIANSFGGDIDVSNFSSTSNTSASFTTINGASTSDASAILGATPQNVSTGFATAASGTAYSAATASSPGTAASFTATVAAADLANFGASNNLEVDFGNYTVTVANADTASAATIAAAINQLTSDWTFSANGDVLTGTANNSGVHSAISLTEVDAAGAADAAGTGLSSTAGTVVSMSVATAGVDPTAAAAESGGTNMYLNMSAADTYSMTVDGTAVNFTYAGTAASLSNVATVVDTAMGAGYTVSVENSQLRVLKDDGTAITLAAFSSSAGGTITASTDAATAGVQGASELLDDASFVQAAGADAVGVATATNTLITFTADDVYSFKLSDGTRTAVVDATSVDVTNSDVDDMVAAITYGLAQAGMSNSITAVAGDGTNGAAVGEILLTQAAGKTISFSDFTSDQAGAMGTEVGAVGTTGVARFLDDGNATNAQTVSSIAVNTATQAAAAITVIDNALKEIAAERASLGAIVNRLDHTVNNLTNVSINMTAARGRVEDADFAAESTNLAKSQILAQASTAMLAQANASKQSVLSLLQG